MSSQDTNVFRTEALANNVNNDTVAVLIEHGYASTGSLENLNRETVDALGLPHVQKGLLMVWVNKLRQRPDGITSKGPVMRARQPSARCGRLPDQNAAQEAAEGLKKKVTPNMRMSQLNASIDECVTDFLDSKIKVCVVGRSGAGKSSLINCILNLKATEEGAAKVGIVECTRDPVSYQHPSMPGITIWDVPGVGTDKFPRDTYLQTVDFSSFDVFIIICSDRIGEDDTWLAKNAEKQKKPFFFVRSKIDQDIPNVMRDSNIEAAEAIAMSRSDTGNILKGQGVKAPQIYIVSGVLDYQFSFDFPLLMRHLAEQCPKKDVTAMVMAIVSCSSEIIERKKEIFQERIYSIARKAVSDDINFATSIIDEIMQYVRHFGLSDQHVEKWEIQVRNLGQRLQEIRESLQVITQPLRRGKDFMEKLADLPIFKRTGFFKRARKRSDETYAATAEAVAAQRNVMTEHVQRCLQQVLEDSALLALGLLEEKKNVTLEKCNGTKLVNAVKVFC